MDKKENIPEKFDNFKKKKHVFVLTKYIIKSSNMVNFQTLITTWNLSWHMEEVQAVFLLTASYLSGEYSVHKLAPPPSQLALDATSRPLQIIPPPS